MKNSSSCGQSRSNDCQLCAIKYDYDIDFNDGSFFFNFFSLQYEHHSIPFFYPNILLRQMHCYCCHFFSSSHSIKLGLFSIVFPCRQLKHTLSLFAVTRIGKLNGRGEKRNCKRLSPQHKKADLEFSIQST